MRLGKFTKTSAEIKRYTIDYSEWLDTGETILSVEFDVSPATTPALEISGSEISDDGLIVGFFVAGGDDGETYQVLVTIVTSGQQKKQDYALFAVVDP